MRKFSKIIAVLLAVTLIAGVIAIISTATPPASTTTNGLAYDFEDYKEGDNFTKNFGSGTGDANKYSSYSIVSTGNNKYYRYASTALDAPKAYRRDLLYGTYNVTTGTRLSDYSYFTVDFDVTADKYLYTLDGVEMMSETVPEGAENVRASFSNNTYFSMDNRAVIDGAFSGTGYAILYVKFVYANEAWNVYCGTSAGAAKDTGYDLLDTPGAWNHFTYAVQVIENDNGSYGQSMVHLFFNGQLIGTSMINSNGTVQKTTGKVINPRALDWYPGSTSQLYSMGIDNFIPTYYPVGYTSGDAYGIDDYFADEDENALIVNCADVVYNKEYTYLDENPYISVDTGSTKVFIEAFKEETLKGVTDGTVIESYFDILDFTPPSNVNSFEVYLLDGAEFTLSDAASRIYKMEISPLGYRVSRKTNDDSIIIRWLDSKGGNLIKEETLNFGVAPEFDGDVINGAFDYATGEISNISGFSWMWDIDGDGNSSIGLDRDPIEIGVLSANEFELVRQYCGGVIDIFPVGGDKQVESTLLYAIKNYDSTGTPSLMLDENGSVDSYYDLSTFAAMVDSAPSGSEIYLYSDIDVDSTIFVEKNKSLNLDLNGHTLRFFGNFAFILDNNSTIRVYSSLPGANLIANEAIFVTESLDDTFFNGCNIYLGAYGKISGDNLLCMSDYIVALYTDLECVDDKKDATVAINGGTYIGSFMLYAVDANVSVENATIYAQAEPFYSCDGAEVFLYVDNSNILSELASNIFDVWSEKSVAYFEDSNILSALDWFDYVTENGVVYLGENNYLGVEPDLKKVVMLDGVLLAVTNAEVEVPYIDTFNAAFVSFSAEELNSDKFTTARFLDANDKIFKEVYYHCEYLALELPTYTEMNDRKQFPIYEDLDNGWYDKGYNAWKNTTDGVSEGDFTLVFGEDVVNTFVPVVDGVIPSVDAKVNASLKFSCPALTVYIPMIDESSDITINDIYGLSESGDYLHCDINENMAGAEGMIGITVYLGLDSFDSQYVYVEYTAIVDGAPIQLVAEFELNFLDYAEAVAEIYSCGSDDAKVVYELIRFKNEAYKLANGVANAEAEQILASHGDKCKCLVDLDELQFSEKELAANKDNFDGIISYVSIQAGPDGAYPLFMVSGDVDVKSITAQVKAPAHQLGGWQMINNTVTYNLVWVGAEYDEEGNAYNIYSFEEIAFAGAAEIMKLRIEVVTSPATTTSPEVTEVVEGEWCYASLADSFSVGYPDAESFLKAFYTLAKAALEFRNIRSGEGA